MSDFEKLINASDLIEWIMETDPDWCVGAVRSIVDHIDEMPSARPTGEWHIEIDTGSEMYACSECGSRMIKKWYDRAVGSSGYRFCPNCGAKMGGK